MKIKSYGRLLDDCSNLMPFISPYSYASLKSEKLVIAEDSEGRSFMDLESFRNGSTSVEYASGCGFASC
jgi:hypothetical protein